MEITLNKETVFTDEETENYLIAVYAGIITKATLSLDYHLKISEKLIKGVKKGLNHFCQTHQQSNYTTTL